MVNNELTTWNNFELQLYRLVGVHQFRKAILWFEKIRHRKDNQKNENYHPSNFDIFSLERYNGFLLYNAFWHFISLFFTVVYVVFTTAIVFRNICFDFCMSALTVFNVYCIILQRNNYLKLKEYRCKYYKRFQRRSELCKKEALQKAYALDPHTFQTDYEVLFRMKKAFDGQADCVLSRTDIESLKRICSYFEPISINKQEIKKTLAVGLIEKCNYISEPYTILQARADSLRKRRRKNCILYLREITLYRVLRNPNLLL